MSDATGMLPDEVKVTIRRGAATEEVTLTEPTWKVMKPLVGTITEHINRLLAYREQGGQGLDLALLSNVLAAALPEEIILAATSKDAAWLGEVTTSGVAQLLDAALGVTLHPDLFPALKKIAGRLTAMGTDTGET